MKPYYDYCLVHGFHFPAEPPADIRERRYLDSADPEEVVCAVLSNAREGDFSHFDQLARVMHETDEYDIWASCGQLYKYAAPVSALHRLLDSFEAPLRREPDGVIQQWIGEIILGSKGLWAVPIALELFRHQDHQRFFATPTHLSYLLEDKRGEIASGPRDIREFSNDDEFYEPPPAWDDAGFAMLVLARHAELASRLPSPTRDAVFEGEPLNLQRVAERLLDRLPRVSDEFEEIYTGRDIFEAQTGIDCSSFYRDSRLQRLTAAAILQDFLASGQAASFETGVRYFFGRRIPD
jgi:hypothetical protein